MTLREFGQVTCTSTHGRLALGLYGEQMAGAEFVPISIFAAGRYGMCCLMQR